MPCCDNTHNSSLQPNSVSEDCIIAYKIFDQCRKQICLTPCILGPARCAKNNAQCSEIIQEGDVIVPPINAASVSLDDLTLCRILITKKKENPFRTGYWDVEIKFVFNYTLTFRDSECEFITCCHATSIYTLRMTLFGSIGSETAMATDLVNTAGINTSSGPFVSVEAKAAGLAAELKLTPRCNCSCDCDDNITEVPTAVCVTIGLFAIVRLFRPVNMVVRNFGCCVPEECTGAEAATNVCDFFNSLTFPSDMFCPPTLSDIQGKNTSNSNGCNCGCE